MKKYLFVAAAVSALAMPAMPAMADEVGVRAGPVGAGVTVGEGHRDYDRDRDRDRTTVIKEHEPRDRETVIKKEREDGVESKTTIHRKARRHPGRTGNQDPDNCEHQNRQGAWH